MLGYEITLSYDIKVACAKGLYGVLRHRRDIMQWIRVQINVTLALSTAVSQRTDMCAWQFLNVTCKIMTEIRPNKTLQLA